MIALARDGFNRRREASKQGGSPGETEACPQCQGTELVEFYTPWGTPAVMRCPRCCQPQGSEVNCASADPEACPQCRGTKIVEFYTTWGSLAAMRCPRCSRGERRAA